MLRVSINKWISERVDSNDRRVIPLTHLRVEANLSQSRRYELPEIRTAVQYHQIPNRDNGRYDLINIGCHPNLVEFVETIQTEYFDRAPAASAKWIRRFTFRKALQRENAL